MFGHFTTLCMKGLRERPIAEDVRILTIFFYQNRPPITTMLIEQYNANKISEKN